MNKYNIKREDFVQTLEEIAQYMRHARERKGFTQKELAEIMNVSPPRILSIENARCGYTITFFINLSSIIIPKPSVMNVVNSLNFVKKINITAPIIKGRTVPITV